jgi:hypothetical protein
MRYLILVLLVLAPTVHAAPSARRCTRACQVANWKTRSVFGRYNLGDVDKLRERLAATRNRRGKVVPLRARRA